MIVDKKGIASIIDHTFLKNEENNISKSEQEKNVKNLCKEANQFDAFSVCVRPDMVALARTELLQLKSHVIVCSVIGFPDGDKYSTDLKIDELELARSSGAKEFDMVIKVKDLKNGNNDVVYQDILNVSKAAKNDVLKVIFENVYLSQEEKLRAYNIAIDAFNASKTNGVRFLKTSTGFAKASGAIGATLEDIKLMHSVSKGKFGIKPAGGINSFESAIEFWNAVGAPKLKTGSPDPMKFRIGSSSLLMNMFEKEGIAGGY